MSGQLNCLNISISHRFEIVCIAEFFLYASDLDKVFWTL